MRASIAGRALIAGSVTLALGSGALAAEVAISISIPVTGGAAVQSTGVAYDCGGKAVAATYVDAGTVSLAVLEIDGETVVASNVVAASGAKYAGGRYVWWTKGEGADLYDLIQGGEETPAARCDIAG